MGTERALPPGVRTLDHTADVGLEIEGPNLPELFRRAALGTIGLVLEASPGEPSDSRGFEASEEELPALLRAWLREILYWHEVEAFALADAEVRTVRAGRLEAVAWGGPPSADPVREIKGVTWHALCVEERADGWFARVIFDV